MRWNNIGIGYLDQLQYEDAMHAFEQVVRLRPDYKDGYINVGLTYIEWEKYAEARAPLEKALTLHPDDARALYYLALVERRQRHSEAEIADLQKVVAQYPQSRDARRELGISYYQQHRSDEAMEQFKALQAIDPDDLAAHYNLAILYRRDGHEETSRGRIRTLHRKENRSWRADLFAGLSAQASGDLDRERALACAYRNRRTQATAPQDNHKYMRMVFRLNRRKFHPFAQPHSAGSAVCGHPRAGIAAGSSRHRRNSQKDRPAGARLMTRSPRRRRPDRSLRSRARRWASASSTW